MAQQSAKTKKRSLIMTTNQIATEVQGQEVQPVKRGRGRPKGSKNKPKAPAAE